MMFDNVGIAVPGGRISPSLFSLAEPTIYGHRVHLKNLQIRQNEDGVYLHGSLSRFLKGENVHDLTRQTLEQALEKVEQETGLDLNKGKIMKAEVGKTFSMKFPCRVYLEQWGTMPRFKRVVYEEHETVYYDQKKNSS